MAMDAGGGRYINPNAALRRSAEDFNLAMGLYPFPASANAALRRSAEDFNIAGVDFQDKPFI